MLHKIFAIIIILIIITTFTSIIIVILLITMNAWHYPDRYGEQAVTLTEQISATHHTVEHVAQLRRTRVVDTLVDFVLGTLAAPVVDDERRGVATEGGGVARSRDGARYPPSGEVVGRLKRPRPLRR